MIQASEFGWWSGFVTSGETTTTYSEHFTLKKLSFQMSRGFMWSS